MLWMRVLTSITSSFFVFSSDRRGVSGNAMKGCNAIIISAQDKYCSSQDFLNLFTYFVRTAHGARSLYTSFLKQLVIRVFRSSKLEGSLFAPPLPPDENSAVYRYDGLYYITQVLDDQGCVVIGKSLHTGPTVYRFILTRALPIEDGNCLTNDEFIKQSIDGGTMKTIAGEYCGIGKYFYSVPCCLLVPLLTCLFQLKS
jgi:hypothetical protein